MQKASLSVSLTDQEKAALRKIAQEWGLVIPSGLMAGAGSIRKLLLALCEGRAIFLPFSTEDQNTVELVHQLEGQYPGHLLIERLIRAVQLAEEFSAE